MKYLLNDGWALRGWESQVWLLYPFIQGQRTRTLSRRAFFFLQQCDGQTELPEDEIARHYLELGVIRAGEGVLAPRQRYRYRVHRYVSAVQWSITGRCNYNCVHCFSAVDTAPHMDEFSLEQCTRIADELADCGIEQVFITGGEPLLHPHFMDIIDLLLARDIKIAEILTNGSLLTPEILSALKERDLKPVIGVSFDGLGNHDWMRGVPRAEAVAVRAIRLCVEAGFPVKGTINVNHRSKPRMLETCRYLKDLGCSTLFLIRTSEVPRWAATGEPFFGITDYLDLILDVADACLREQWRLRLEFFNACHITNAGEIVPSCMLQPSEPGGHRLLTCGRLLNGFFIAHDGRILPCDAFEGVTTAYGHLSGDNNILARPLGDILCHSSLGMITEQTRDEFLAHQPVCRTCPSLKKCWGGCRIFAYGWNGDPLGTSPVNCTYHRGGYADQMQALTAAYRAGDPAVAAIDPDSGLSLLRMAQKKDCKGEQAMADFFARMGDLPLTMRK